LNKANVLAAGVLLTGVGLYGLWLYAIYLYQKTVSENPAIGTLITFAGEPVNFSYLMTAIFWSGMIIVITSILMKPRRRIVAPVESTYSGAVEAYRKEAAYSGEEVGAVEKREVGLEQAYEEEAPAEESYEATEEEAAEKEEKPEKVGEIVGFCPRCGAPVSEGMRYCRKCGLKLK